MMAECSGRTEYFDYLRVFAIFAIMILHISAQNWYLTNVNGVEWQVFNFFESIVNWGNPIFVMISGALFLNREISLKKIYSKYVLRRVAAFAVWSIVYAYFSQEDTISRILEVISGHYHMWFIWMIIGLYISIPFLKIFIKDDKITKYFLELVFIFTFLIPSIITVVNDFGGEIGIKVVSAFNTNIKNMNFNIVLGYTGYFILGYYLNNTELNKKQRRLIYIFGGIGFLLTLVLDSVVALKTQQPCGNYYGNFTINILFESLAVFTWFKYKKYYFRKLYPFVLRLSEYSFGAYLVHDLVINQLNNIFGLNTLSFNPALAVACIGIIVFAISFGVSAILNQIPVVNKYIV